MEVTTEISSHFLEVRLLTSKSMLFYVTFCSAEVSSALECNYPLIICLRHYSSALSFMSFSKLLPKSKIKQCQDNESCCEKKNNKTNISSYCMNGIKSVLLPQTVVSTMWKLLGLCLFLVLWNSFFFLCDRLLNEHHT